MKELINQARLNRLFTDLVKIDSISYQERNAADYIKNALIELNADVYEDEAWKHYFKAEKDSSDESAAQAIANVLSLDSNLLSGNIYAYIAGSIPGKPLMFSAHMDTVSPGIGKKPVLDKDKYISGGNTVLGADDMAGVAQIIEAVRLLKENHIPHRSLELVFPVAEEVYGQGCAVLDYSKLKAEEAYVLDLGGRIGMAALQAPSIISFVIEIQGRSAHAGFAPEEGIHAIKIAAEAINKLHLGRIDKDSTRNIGIAHGGSGRNIIPDSLTIEGEIRSYNHQRAIQLLEETKLLFHDMSARRGAKVIISSKIGIKAYQIEKTSHVVKRFFNACKHLGIDAEVLSTFGGSDNNHFVQHGIKGIVLSCGMQKVHTKDEFIYLDDLSMGTALAMELMTDAA